MWRANVPILLAKGRVLERPTQQPTVREPSTEEGIVPCLASQRCSMPRYGAYDRSFIIAALYRK